MAAPRAVRRDRERERGRASVANGGEKKLQPPLVVQQHHQHQQQQQQHQAQQREGHLSSDSSSDDESRPTSNGLSNGTAAHAGSRKRSVSRDRKIGKTISPSAYQKLPAVHNVAVTYFTMVALLALCPPAVICL